MDNILIEKYRGFDIEFNVNSETFVSVITDETTKESVSFKSVKKFIDDYRKNNQDFVPFFIETVPDGYSPKRLKVIGIRKDDRFIVENEKGKIDQISSYNESDYMILKEENKETLGLLEEQYVNFEKLRVEYNEKRKELKSKLNIVTLKDFKKELKS